MHHDPVRNKIFVFVFLFSSFFFVVVVRACVFIIFYLHFQFFLLLFRFIFISHFILKNGSRTWNALMSAREMWSPTKKPLPFLLRLSRFSKYSTHLGSTVYANSSFKDTSCASRVVRALPTMSLSPSTISSMCPLSTAFCP